MPFRQTLARYGIDPYLIALIATVAAAAVLPVRGSGAAVMDQLVIAAVALLFFLYGARLSTESVVAGLTHWRLQLTVFLATFALFPLLGLIATSLLKPLLPADLTLGLMFMCVLPSTVQSSIAFTSIARGNVPAALCSASVSNLIGMFITPILTALLLSSQGVTFDFGAVEKIVLQLLVPFIAGQLLRPFIGSFIKRHRFVIGYVDRGSILLVVYAAFSAGVVAGIWAKVGLESLGVVLGLDSLLLAIVILTTTYASRRLGFSKEDEITIVFCGSKKSLASGVPMANILFPGQGLGMIVLPIMLFHQIQLFVCAFMAQSYARRPIEAAPGPEPLPQAAGE